MSILEGIESKQVLELFTNPVKWCEAFLRNPDDKDKAFQLRSYQREILEKTRQYRRIILRYGRRMGKSITICADTLWWCSAYPIVRMIEEGRKRQLPYTVIIATPYETQIKELWSIYAALIADSPLLRKQIVKIRTSDIHTIEFDNESIIKGYTIGISSSNRGTSLRSLSADMVFLDEMDFIPREIIEQVIMPIWTTHSDTRLRVCSTPSGQRSLFYEWCFPKNTPISTIHGPRNIQDIKIGDTVFSENGIIDTVSNIFTHTHNGLFYKFRTKVSEFECTEEHPVLSTTQLELEPTYKLAKDIKQGHYLVHPIKKYTDIPLVYDLNIFKTEIELKREQIYDNYIRSSLSKKEFCRQTTSISLSQLSKYIRQINLGNKLWMFDKRLQKSIINTNEILNDIYQNKHDLTKLCRLLGYYLSEGNLLKSKNYSSSNSRTYYGGLRFSFNSNEIKHIQEVVDLTLSLFPNTKIKIINNLGQKCTMILCYNTILSYLFKILGGESCCNKTIHPFFMSKKENIEILNTFINDYCNSLTTMSMRLADDLFNIAILNKISLARYKTTKKNGKISYTLHKLANPYHFKENYFLSQVKNIVITNKIENVFNLETRNTHQYIVDNTLVHNCTKADELGWLHRHYPSWHPDNTNWMSIQQAKDKGISVTESTEYQVKAITSAATYEREYGAEFGEEFGGVYKNHLIARCLKKYGRNIDVTNSEIFDPGFKQNVNNYYIIGVDWNSYINGGQVVLVEYCKEQTIEQFFDDESGTDVTIDFTGKYRLFYRRGIFSKEATQRKTREEIIRLLKSYKIDYIYVDYGAGDTNIEELTLYGKDHPELGLNRKLKAVDSGASVEHFDPVLGRLIKKRNKSLMVNFSALNLEENMYILPKEEDEPTRLVGQMRGYQIKNVTSRGDYTYVGEDHILDAFNLAIYGFQREYGSILNNKITYRIISMNDPRLNDYPTRAQEILDSPIAPAKQSRRIVDPEKVIQKPRIPVRIKMPSARPNINFRTRSIF